jgi:hypothetical protein
LSIVLLQTPLIPSESQLAVKGKSGTGHPEIIVITRSNDINAFVPDLLGAKQDAIKKRGFRVSRSKHVMARFKIITKLKKASIC